MDPGPGPGLGDLGGDKPGAARRVAAGPLGVTDGVHQEHAEREHDDEQKVRQRTLRP
ncbi:hypothetical protein [Streptomyces sp. NPDC059247]|uniref:hypothetical protein n=1 Tax=Streptomyces sp. NPDC059247 TaxID=3346790 RepID=UPI0036A9F8EC